jgi:CBS domain-containing protein
MLISDILKTKGSRVVTVDPALQIQEAMRMLVAHNIGALVVVAERDVLGIITERDLLRTAAENVQRLSEATVRDLMTTAVITMGSDADIRAVMNTMTERKIRHLPIIDRGELRGIISIGDVVNALRESVEEENHQLQAYIAGTPA